MDRRTKRLTVTIRVRFEPEFYEELKRISEATGWSISEVIRYMTIPCSDRMFRFPFTSLWRF